MVTTSAKTSHIPSRNRWRLLGALAWTLWAIPVAAQNAPPSSRSESHASDQKEEQEQTGDPESIGLVEEIDVVERGDDLVGIAVSASEGTTGAIDLARRPLLRPGDVIETVPGLVATQHSGSGKANQYFVRGFNLDHGTDFSISVDGVPVNMPSHGHGQGYADLNFLIPEMVERARYRKGPYWAEVGDFSTAGSLDIDLVNTLPQGLVSLTGGSFGYGRGLWADTAELDEGDLLFAIEAFHDDGPFVREDDYRGGRGMLRWSHGDSTRSFSVTALGYDAEWLSTDQIPRRAVESGELGRFDLVDPGSRGSTARLSLSAKAHRARERGIDRLNAYVLSYDFDLISNFTYSLEDPEHGDQFRQLDERQVAGFGIERASLGTLAGRRLETRFGFTARYDDIDNALLRTQKLEIRAPVRRDRIEQITGGPSFESRVQMNDWLRIAAGLRLDLYHADVESDLPSNSGSENDLLLSPKLSLALGPWNQTELYLNYGHGFHSNDARGAVIRVDPITGEPVDRVEPLVETRGIDVGVRTELVRGLQSTLTIFALDLDSELVFVGDGGATEAGRPSRRLGIEWANHYRLGSALSLELDATWTDATFRDDGPAGDEVPGSVGRTVSAGLSFGNDEPWSGSLRWRYFGDIPLIEDGSVVWSSSSTLNSQLAFRLSNGFTVTLMGFNMLDRKHSDVEYFYASRLPGEPASGVEDVHFHPLPERSFRLALTWRR